MGEPAVPTPAERADTLDLAQRIVDSVRDDESLPSEFWLIASTSMELPLFRLAQDLVDANAELERVREVVRIASEWRETWRHRRPYGDSRIAEALVDAVDVLEGRAQPAPSAPYSLTANDRDAIQFHARDFAKWLALGDADGNARSADDVIDRIERMLTSELKHRGEPPVRRRL